MDNQLVKLIWTGNLPEELLPLVQTLKEEFPISDSGKGLKLHFKKISGDGIIANVQRGRGEVTIEYNTVTGAARGIGSALSRLDGKEHTQLDKIGIMLDVSRNQVLTVEHIKSWLRKLALCGFNRVYIYAEDTYELESEPLFGYHRGAYSIEELKELDGYANTLGIELVGCIQTLGHLEQFLKWNPCFNRYGDTRRIMMVDCPDVYQLVEKQLEFWSSALSSRYIHLGMDEVHDLGRGRYLDYNSYEDGFTLFNRHFNRVNEICNKLGLKPQIWSDMYFRLGNQEREYYCPDSKIPEKVKNAIPSNAQLVYWDYYNTSSDIYDRMIKSHIKLGSVPVMASGIWTWAKLWYDHEQTRKTVIPCLEACRKNQVKELFFTMWGDDGAYCNRDSALAGIFYTGDLIYGSEDYELTASRFDKLCFPSSYEAHIAAGQLDCQLTDEEGNEYRVAGAMLLWDDPLLGIYFDNCRNVDPEFDLRMLDHYEELLCRVLPFFDANGAGDLEHAANIAAAIIKKLELRGALISAYDQNDMVALREIAVKQIPAVIAAVSEFDASFRSQWHHCAKPFGLECIQIRNAGLIARLEETAARINEYISGAIERIDELEEHLPKDIKGTLHNLYSRVSTAASNICWI